METENTKKGNNNLQVWGNERTMNLNHLVLTNIQGSPYFKNELYQLKTYHEVVDEIYYKVTHLEPWEKGSRKTSGQVGMCGGVRGVGAGGIVSTAYCLLYKLFTLKLTRKQLNGLITHVDSPYIRGLGFMYIRYCIQPSEMYDWFEPYLEDEEELDVKAGEGCTMTMGQMVRSFLLKLEWFGTLFPRIPVPVQKDIETRLKAIGLNDVHKRTAADGWGEAEDYSRRAAEGYEKDNIHNDGEKDQPNIDRKERYRSRSRERQRRRSRSKERSTSTDKRRSRSRDRDRERERDRDRERRERERNRERQRGSERDRASERKRDCSPSGDRQKDVDRHRSQNKDDKKDYDRYKSERRRSRSRERTKTEDRRERERERSRHGSRDRQSEKNRKRSKSRDRSR